MKKQRNLLLGVFGVIVVGIGFLFVYLSNKTRLTGVWKSEAVYMVTNKDDLLKNGIYKEKITEKDMEELDFIQDDREVITEIKHTSKKITLETIDKETNISYMSSFTYKKENQSYLITWESNKIVFPKGVDFLEGTKRDNSDKYYYDTQDKASYIDYYEKNNETILFNPETMKLEGTTLTKVKLFKNEVPEGKLFFSEDKKNLYLVNSIGTTDPYYFIRKYTK